MSEPGVVYLLHLDPPLEHAKHYVGFCEKESGLDSRLEYHQAGRGSKLLAAQVARGGKFTLVRLWKGTRNDERAIKNGKQAPRYCPCCADKPWNRRGMEELRI